MASKEVSWKGFLRDSKSLVLADMPEALLRESRERLASAGESAEMLGLRKVCATEIVDLIDNLRGQRSRIPIESEAIHRGINECQNLNSKSLVMRTLYLNAEQHYDRVSPYVPHEIGVKARRADLVQVSFELLNQQHNHEYRLLAEEVSVRNAQVTGLVQEVAKLNLDAAKVKTLKIENEMYLKEVSTVINQKRLLQTAGRLEVQELEDKLIAIKSNHSRKLMVQENIIREMHERNDMRGLHCQKMARDLHRVLHELREHRLSLPADMESADNDIFDAGTGEYIGFQVNLVDSAVPAKVVAPVTAMLCDPVQPAVSTASALPGDSEKFAPVKRILLTEADKAANN